MSIKESVCSGNVPWIVYGILGIILSLGFDWVYKSVKSKLFFCREQFLLVFLLERLVQLRLNNMNILFLGQNFNIGGVGIVTKELANFFCSKCHHVSVFAFNNDHLGVEEMLDEKINVYVGCSNSKFKYSNVKILSEALKIERPDLIINNWGLPWRFILTARLALKRTGLKTKVISVYHNDPKANGKLQKIDTVLKSNCSVFKSFWLRCIRRIVEQVTSMSMRYVYNNSDAYQLLSKSFVVPFEEFTGIKNANKLIVQSNPLTIDKSGFVFSPKTKRKEILYVGRLDPIQKKVSRVIDIWNVLEKKYPDWNLTIVGDGEERKELEDRIEKYQLKNVKLEGRQAPREYYERASILLLTSDFEGFGLVLVEGMSFGVVPVVYNSYTALQDIIVDEYNGLLYSSTNGLFSAEEMALKVESLICDNDKLSNMMNNAIRTSEKFSMDSIYEQWENKIFKLCE